MTEKRASSQTVAQRSRLDIAAEIAAQLEGMTFGSLMITVHDGRIVHFERTEKKRLA